jgi:hypothetical protein
MRHVQLQYDLIGEEVGKVVSAAIKIDDLFENQPKTFSFEIPPLSQMPDDIKVSRNLSLTLHSGNVSASIAWMVYLTKPEWSCNIVDIPIGNLTETKMFFSKYQGVNADGDYRKVFDFVEFFDPAMVSSGSKVFLNGFSFGLLAFASLLRHYSLRH